jgi:hydroxymethylbilane synthase
LLDRRIDVAVHSLKDVPAALAPGLVLAAFPPREDPRDLLLSRAGGALDDLPRGSVVGTSSLRRRALVLARRSDLAIEPIRGNVDTRLAKLEQGAYDAIVLAKAGLDRLGLAPAGAVALSVDEFPPAVGQGILAVEAREADREHLELLAMVNDTRTSMAALAERSYLRALGADCHTPVAGYAVDDGTSLALTGLVASLDGRTVLRASVAGASSKAESLGVGLAADLLARGAAALIDDPEGHKPR